MIQLLFANEYQNSVNYRRIDRRQTKKNCHSKSAIGAGAKVQLIIAIKFRIIKKSLQMGMISVAGAPILNSKNETRRPSFIKTKDQEMMKS